ncbi:MAG: hypothetical protein JOY80_01890, partial [Candidatus Dormibacteraeota bacterium]|nr:hypothetical protein [Candidatus Dormibacteraeota bacterium]
MNETVDVGASIEYAALIAVEIDRTREPIIQGSRGRVIAAGLPQRLGLSPAGMQLLPFLRNLLPDRAVDANALRACERYVPQSTYDTAMSELVSAALIETRGTTVLLSANGREISAEIHDILAEDVNERWGQDPGLTQLEQLTQRAVEAALATGGLSFRVMAPPYDPPSSTAGSRSAERLNCLRVHR